MPWETLARDAKWSKRGDARGQTGLVTFGILALELALIRWTSGQVRAFADAALGANLLGAVLGGCLEYLSLYAGMLSGALLALELCLLACVLARRRLVPVAA